jgi:hypothetical protein
MDRFTGTMLTREGTTEDTNRAVLDLLKKLNMVSASAADAATVDAIIGSVSSSLIASAKGMKSGLDVVYVSADVLSINPGVVEINGEIIFIDAPLAITASMPNFPAAGAWAYVTMEKDGTHRLFPATGTAAQRPTDNCFQLTGGGVGFNDIEKGSYYFDPLRRIIDVIHRVNATTWYCINVQAWLDETGRNSNGNYCKCSNGILSQWNGVPTPTGAANIAFTLPVAFGTFAAGFGMGDASISGSYVPTSNNGTFYQFWLSNITTGNYYISTAQPLQWHAVGRWRA